MERLLIPQKNPVLRQSKTGFFLRYEHHPDRMVL